MDTASPDHSALTKLISRQLKGHQIDLKDEECDDLIRQATEHGIALGSEQVRDSLETVADEWYILSVKCGLVQLVQVIASYDSTLADMFPSDHCKPTADVLEQLPPHLAAGGRSTIQT